MPADTFSNILNWAIPIVIVVVFLAVIIKSFGTPLGSFFEWFMKFIGYGKDKMGDAINSGGYDIVYR